MTKEKNKDKILHDQLDDHFGDPQRKKLIDALDSVLERKESLKKNRVKRLIKIVIPLAAAIIIFVIYFVFLMNPKESETQEAPILVTSEDTTGLSPKIGFKDKVEEGKEITPEVQKEKSFEQKAKENLEADPEFYAMIEMERFTPNTQLEALTQSTVRGESLDIQFTKSIPKIYTITRKNPSISLEIEGSISGTKDITEFTILFFNNTSVNAPLLELPVKVKMDSSRQHRFTLQKRLTLDYGLYYYILESDLGKILAGGKFRVETTH